jgi:hypothetical protein
MKRKLTTAVWAGAMLALALVSVPAAGQNRVGIPADRMPVLKQGMELRAGVHWWLDPVAWPDSTVIYTGTGEKNKKLIYGYYDNGNRFIAEIYEWLNNRWVPVENRINLWEIGVLIPNSVFQAYLSVNDRWGVDILDINFPTGIISSSYWGWEKSLVTPYPFEEKYDSKGHLIYLKVRLEEFKMEYNTSGQLISLERYCTSQNDILYLDFTINYTYSDKGLLVYAEAKQSSSENDPLVIRIKEINKYDTEGRLVSIEHYETGYDAKEEWSSNEYTCYKVEYKEDNNGNQAATYMYSWNTVSGRWTLVRQIINYPNTLTPSAVEPVPERVATRVWSSGGQLYIAAASAGRAQVYTVAGQLMATVALAAGETVATPLPPGVYIVAAEGKTWKVINN